ncbi:hypothetical protein PsorP6_016337 [Peronosclerospora sorghi]|uniref:Uncharacterized protein n=1 Tax=Peronosclerospora sorghi TaxID=230839 RepID=A0ACC0VPY6_9STRA|nr:hypothetical protein PsorP6_016337 [Peronosclerospora sorghi]
MGHCAIVISSFDFTNGKASSARPQGTIVRNIVDVKPELVELGSTDDWIGEMTDLVLVMYHRNMGMYNQVVENLLLKDLLGP